METVYEFTRETAPAAKGYWAREAESLLRQYPQAQRVRVVRRGNNSQVRYVPAPGEVLCVPATSGKYGKNRITRVG